ncbi:type III-B CRISPR module RAMP protein Cmr1 [Methylocaldum sp. MU1018]
MNTLTATYRIVTPMFLGDAEQNATEIRPPSVKGALRFWWRALNWGRFRADTDDATALRRLHEAEADLFGAAAEEKSVKRGQSRFLLTVQSNALKFKGKNHVHARFQSHDAARYLGYGLMEAFASKAKNTQAGQLMRGCIDEGQSFKVKLLCRGEEGQSVREALIALGLLGGLGSRSRHGMGSLSLIELQQNEEPVWKAPANREDYIKAVRDLFAGKRTTSTEPPYSAFANTTRVDVLLETASPYQALDGFGRGELMYRSWGKDGKVLGERREERFKADHDWSKKTRPQGFHPRRVIFGLPHNYGKGPSMEVGPSRHKRRASPLLFHVHALGEKSFIGVSILLNSVFLPHGEKINAGGTEVPAKIEWDLLTDFLDGKDQAGNFRFPKKVTV